MNDNVVKLVIKTIMAGSGFEKMNAQTSELMKKMGKMSQGVTIMGRAFGNLGVTIGQSLGMLMQGGIWGAAAGVATVAIEKAVNVFQKWKTAAEDARLAAKGLSREYLTMEYAHAQYLKRVESWKKKREESDRAEKDAAEKKRKAAEAYLETQRKAEEFAVAYAAAEHKIAQESMKAGLESDKEIVRIRTRVKLMMEEAKARVKAAEEQVRLKAKNGDEQGMMLAKKDLELAVVQQANTVTQAKKLVEEYTKAKDLAEEETDIRMGEMRREDFAREEQNKKRERLEKAQAETRKKYAEAVKRIEDEIARKKEEAAKIEENAQRARGVGFGDWARGERNRAKEDRMAAGQQAKREAAVDAEIARLEKTNPRTRTEWQRNRLAQLNSWKASQDPANNAAKKALDALNEKRDKLIADQNKTLDKIAKLLEESVNL